MAKRYGLIVKDKPVNRPAIFNSDSDSEGEQEKPTGITAIKKKERLAQEKAIAEDPTVYQYDELYDDMQAKKKETKMAKQDLSRKPKYITNLLETAERRKRENERRIERQVQKEREEEGDKFKDKESFVTAAYRQKLEEFRKMEEEEKREEYLESIGDVQKQADLSGFYRHLYAQKMNYEETDESEPPKKGNLEVNTPKQKIDKSQIRKRKYRKREESEPESDKEESVKLQHLPSNIDADSDFSIDSDSEQENAQSKDKPTQTTEIICPNLEQEQSVEEKAPITQKDEDNKHNEIELPKIIPEKKPKIDIWKKRTVGIVFDEALKRYYERKANRTVLIN